jgi:hypothetical protein
MSWSQTRLHYSSLRLQIKANAPSLLCSILLSTPAEKPHQTRLAAAETLPATRWCSRYVSPPLPATPAADSDPYLIFTSPALFPSAGDDDLHRQL